MSVLFLVDCALACDARLPDGAAYNEEAQRAEWEAIKKRKVQKEKEEELSLKAVKRLRSSEDEKSASGGTNEDRASTRGLRKSGKEEAVEGERGASVAALVAARAATASAASW